MASALRLPVSLHDRGSGRAARRETGDIGRGEGDPDLSPRRHGDGDLQDAGRLLDLPGAEFLPRSAACRCSPASCMPASAAISAAPGGCSISSSPIIRGASAWSCSASRSTSISSAIISWSTCAGCCSPGRLAVVPHPRLFQGLARPPLDAAAARPRAGVAFIWFSENIGTFTKIWLYPSQRHGWSMVSIDKLGSWFLLLIISYTLVSLVNAPRAMVAIRSKAGSRAGRRRQTQRQKHPPEPPLRPVDAPPYGATSSTRRFSARPASVALEPTGASSPTPAVRSRGCADAVNSSPARRRPPRRAAATDRDCSRTAPGCRCGRR